MSPHHNFSLAFTHLNHRLLDSNVHNIRITYRRQINEVNFRSDNFLVRSSSPINVCMQYTMYGSDYLRYLESQANWFNDTLSNSIGLLQIYVDDMLFPALSVPMNLAKMVNPDTHRSLDPEQNKVKAEMAGRTYVSITSSTKSLFGAFQILSWTFNETS